MEKTLLILGAGASKDFNRIFPTGLELIKLVNYHFLTEKKFPEGLETEGFYLSAMMNDISRTFQNDTLFFNKIKNSLWKIQLDYEWHELRNDLTIPISIDNFIAQKVQSGELDPVTKDIIKYSIYYLIKGNEEALSEGQHDLKGNWIYKLAEKTSVYGISEILKNLHIVTFNYDRTFEKYFVDYLSDFIALTKDQVFQLRKNIIHVYGSLGDLEEVPFSLKNEEVNIIKQKYGRIELIDDRNRTKLELANSDNFKKVYFIGFGYDQINVNLLDLDQFKSASFCGTAYQYTDTEVERLRKDYNIEASNISCKDFISKTSI